MARRAFTLIEMLVVLFVIGMVATVIAPRLVAMTDGQAEYDFHRLLMRVGVEARLLAIDTGSTVRITFNDSARAIELSVLDFETSQEYLDKSYLLPDDVELITFMVGDDYVSYSDWIVEYYPDGTGIDCGLEVQSGASLYAVLIEGQDGASYLMDTLEELSDTEWEAGEIEQRID